MSYCLAYGQVVTNTSWLWFERSLLLSALGNAVVCLMIYDGALSINLKDLMLVQQIFTTAFILPPTSFFIFYCLHRRDIAHIRKSKMGIFQYRGGA